MMSFIRGRTQRSKATSEMCSRDHQGDSSPSGSAVAEVAEHYSASLTSIATDVELEAFAPTLQHHVSQLKNRDMRVGSPIIFPLNIFSLLCLPISANIVPYWIPV